MWISLGVCVLVLGVLWPLSHLWVRKLGQQLHHQGRLPDLGHKCLPASLGLYRLKWLGDVIAFLPFLRALWVEKELQDRVALTTYLVVLLVLKIACFLSTVLPDASQQGHLHGFVRRHLVGGKYDLMISGHIGAMYGSLLWMSRRNLLASPCEWYFWMCVIVFGAIVSIGSRSHYTVDILLAPAACHWVWDWHLVN